MPFSVMKVAGLEERAADPRFERMTAEYGGAMNLVGDLGVDSPRCAHGVAARWIASREDAFSTALGFAFRDHFVAVERQIAKRQGHHGKVQFVDAKSSGFDL